MRQLSLRLALDAVLFGPHPLASIMQRATQRIIRGPREVIFEFSNGPAKGLSFSCLSSHRYFVLRHEYEKELLGPLEQLVHPGMTALEIGAHFGYWALVLSRLCGPNGKVCAFEPVLANRLRLEKNLAMNCIANVEVVPFAVSDSCGCVSMTCDGTTSRMEEGAGVAVPATTIDTFLRNRTRPDLILVDVEGFAGKVLGGATQAYSQKFIPTICEIHDRDEERQFRSFASGTKIEQLGKGRRFPHRVLAA